MHSWSDVSCHLCSIAQSEGRCPSKSVRPPSCDDDEVLTYPEWDSLVPGSRKPSTGDKKVPGKKKKKQGADATKPAEPMGDQVACEDT